MKIPMSFWIQYYYLKLLLALANNTDLRMFYCHEMLENPRKVLALVRLNREKVSYSSNDL